MKEATPAKLSSSTASRPLRRTDPRRVCLVHLPKISLGPRKREFLVYFSGALFALGWWFFLDAAISSKHAEPLADPGPYDPVPVRVSFSDWTPGLCSTLGMIIVNLIDKAQLVSDDGDGGINWSDASWGSGGVAWRARLFLFVGFALMAGGMAGSVTVLVIKYVIPSYPFNFGTQWGIANVLQSVLIMLSAIVLWVAQNAESEYEYNLQI
ncbi:Vacuolar protein sorting-associated protein 68 [Microbotryomycetes sp. JL201]|nr:Vacuolar protein sorting-associated protein 68 [Microbotryomycetes sp. JL201]